MRRALHGHIVYDREGPAGWAVVIMPDYILIDSYHGAPHVHTNPGRPRDRKLAIRLPDRESVLRAVEAHLEANRGVVPRRLLAELVSHR